jgi:hypothetical protein
LSFSSCLPPSLPFLFFFRAQRMEKAPLCFCNRWCLVPTWTRF